jgi:hypothetical protein
MPQSWYEDWFRLRCHHTICLQCLCQLRIVCRLSGPILFRMKLYLQTIISTINDMAEMYTEAMYPSLYGVLYA